LKYVFSGITTFTEINREQVTEEYLQEHSELLSAEDVEILEECRVNPNAAKTIKMRKKLLESQYLALATASKLHALSQLYPAGHLNADIMMKRTILASLNSQVDMWN